MKNILKNISVFLLSAALICLALPLKASADFEISGLCQVQADGGETYTVKTLDCDYAHNAYLSLRDMAMALQDTEKAFSLEIQRNGVALYPGEEYSPVGTESVPWEEGENLNVSLRRNTFRIGGRETRYYTLIMEMPSGDYDCFMTALDLAMILDMDITASARGVLQIDTQEPFQISPAALEQEGFFFGVNSVLVGDAATGEIYYRYQADTAYPIASISKLMTYLLTMDAITSGQLSPEDWVTVSAAAHLLAVSDDGLILLQEGEQITVQDLLLGALLPSSNECALCLAEAVAGSEEAFVRKMNQKALDLGLSQASFFNSSGLPAYSDDLIPLQHQNSMSADDLFKMISYLLKVYPQVKDITSLKQATLSSIGFEAYNTNPLLYNLSCVTGLKTGSTNKAGVCLATSLRADDGDMEHDLVVIVLGAETVEERGRVSELLARYALQTFKEGGFETGEEADEEASHGASGELPTHAEEAMERILETVKKRSLRR